MHKKIPDIPADKAELVALFAETLLYGMPHSSWISNDFDFDQAYSLFFSTNQFVF